MENSLQVGWPQHRQALPTCPAYTPTDACERCVYLDDGGKQVFGSCRECNRRPRKEPPWNDIPSGDLVKLPIEATSLHVPRHR